MNKRETGSRYEEAAAEVIQKNGYRILERNFRCREGEIDLIAKEGDYLVFLEVKYRRCSRMGFAVNAVTLAKQKKICRVAQYYLMRRNLPADFPVRFDVAAIDGKRIRVVKNAFPYQGKVRF